MALHVQAHRGARSGKPENSLPAFELALDLGAHSIETDLRLTRDGIVVLYHDEQLEARLCRPIPGKSLPRGLGAAISRLTFNDLNAVALDAVLVTQARKALPPSPASQLFMDQRQRPLYAIPRLVDLLEFMKDYCSDLGRGAGKSADQQARARETRLDLEIKGLLGCPDGPSSGELERQIAKEVRRFGMLDRVCVRAFDHRRLLRIKELEAGMRTGVLLASSRPVDCVHLVRAAAAQEIYPDFRLVDEPLVREMREQGIPLLPWTVNDMDDWEKLAGWGVDGITTDYPGELLLWARQRK